jgi:hypothetical protein
MKQALKILLIVGLSFVSCDKNDMYTGEISVTAGAVTEVDGIPIGQVSVGVFDINALWTNGFSRDEALAVGNFIQGTARFSGLNPGNYVVALITSNSYRQAVQVTPGATVTVNVFN